MGPAWPLGTELNLVHPVTSGNREGFYDDRRHTFSFDILVVASSMWDFDTGHPTGVCAVCSLEIRLRFSLNNTVSSKLRSYIIGW